MKKKFQIHNQSCEDMGQVPNQTVDFVTGSIMWNAGLIAGDWHDNHDVFEFLKKLETIIKEISRVLKNGGIFVTDVSDTAVTVNGEYIAVAAMYSKIAQACGLTLTERHYMLCKTGPDGREQPEHRWTDNFVSEFGNHSNSLQVLVFTKGAGKFNKEAGKIIYANYGEDEEGHPCPFSYEYIEFLVGRFFVTGQTALDPCCGTARFGREVVRRGGEFIGFDINPDYCETAEELFRQHAR